MDRTAPQIRISVLPDEKATVGEPSALLDGRVMSFVFEDGDEKADKLTLSIRNDDLALFEQGEDVLGGTILEVSWGYEGAMSPPRRMMIKSIKGSILLQIEALDLSMQLHRETKARGWQGLTRSAVVQEIAREAGYSGAFLDVQETEEPYDTISQTGETDAAFLARLARLEGFHFWIDDLGFHWKERPLDVAPTHVLEWQTGSAEGSLLEWSIESDLVRRVGKTRIKGRDPIEKKDIDESATSDSDRERATLGGVLEVVDPETGATHLEDRNATAAVRGSSVSTSARALSEAKARFRRAERETVKLKLRAVGDPTLRAKELVEVRGISTLFSGLYYLKNVKHTLDGSGYVCEADAIRDAKGALARGVQAKSQGGQKNTSPAKKPGEVTTFERVDAETGRTVVEYHRGSEVLGVEDPEALESR